MATQWDNLNALAAQIAGKAGIDIDPDEFAAMRDEAVLKLRG